MAPRSNPAFIGRSPAQLSKRGAICVAGDSRIVPLSATLLFDLTATPPSLTAFISDAVLEGGTPFALTVRSDFGAQRPDGSYEFRGDYLQDIQPSGTQYLFGWTFSTAPDGRIVWNGVTGWAGGHIWQITISDVTCVPDPTLFQVEATRADSTLTLRWHAVFTSSAFVLEETTDLTDWSPVATPAALTNDRFSVTLDLDAARKFFRLRRL